MKKICHITVVHPSFDDPRIFHREIKTLIRAGYDVALITQHDKAEVIGGLKIIPLPKPKNRFYRMLFLTRKAYRLALEQEADIYHFHNPELLPWMIRLKKKIGAKIIYDVHEDFPNAIRIKYWIPFIFREIAALTFDICEKLFTRFVDYVIVADDNIKERFFPVHKKITTLFNFPRLKYFKNKETRSNPNLIIHAGSLDELRGGDVMIEAIKLVKNKFTQIKLLLIGNIGNLKYKEYLEKKIKDYNMQNNVLILELMPQKDVIQYMKRAYIGLSLLQSVPKFKKNIPQKVFEYMACGIPAVVSNLPPILSFVQDKNCVILVVPDDIKKIASAIEYLIEHPEEARKMGENGRKAIVNKYNWENESKKLLETYEELTK